MCGIVGLISTDSWGMGSKEYDAFRDLVIFDTVRGPHSTGAVWHEGKNNKVMYAKDAVPGPEFVDEFFPSTSSFSRGSSWIIAHNRYATIGGISTETAHPFMHKGVRGVHNGTIRAYKDYWPEFIKPTDSHTLYTALGEAGQTTEDISKFLKEISDGAYALAWQDGRANFLHLVRNSQRPLHLIKYRGGWCFSSEKFIGLAALSRAGLIDTSPTVIDIKPHRLLTIPLDGTSEAEVTEYTPKAKVFGFHPSRSAWDDYYYGQGYTGAYAQRQLPCPSALPGGDDEDDIIDATYTEIRQSQERNDDRPMPTMLINSPGALQYIKGKMGKRVMKKVKSAIFNLIGHHADSASELMEWLNFWYGLGDNYDQNEYSKQPDLWLVAPNSEVPSTFRGYWVNNDDHNEVVPVRARVAVDTAAIMREKMRTEDVIYNCWDYNVRGVVAYASGELGLAIEINEGGVFDIPAGDLESYGMGDSYPSYMMEPAAHPEVMCRDPKCGEWVDNWVKGNKRKTND